MWRIILALLICLVTANAYSNPPSPTPPEGKKQEQTKAGERKQKASKDERGTQSSPLIVDVLPAKDADEIAKRKSEHEEEKATLDRWLTGATVGLAVITFFLALYTARLWNATKTLAEDASSTSTRQAEEMQKSLKIAGDAARAAQESADASRKMVAAMEDTAERQLRAYVAVSRTVIAEFKEPGGYTRNIVHLTIKNFGQTPAYNLTYWVHIQPGKIPLNQELTRPSTMKDKTFQILAPTDTSEIFIPKPLLDASDSHDITEGRMALYVFGECHYRDVFDREHVTCFRYFHTGTHLTHEDRLTHENELETCDDGNKST